MALKHFYKKERKIYNKPKSLEEAAKNFKMLEIAKNNEFIGTNDLSGNSIAIGQELSFNLNLDIGDTITVMSPSGVQTIVGSLPKQESFKIISIFDSGLSDYNENVAYINYLPLWI